MEWRVKEFDELSNVELYRILQLRVDVFVVEQNCPYPEMDEKDLEAIHVFLWGDGEVLAVSRILPPGVSYKEVSIGRFCTALKGRRNGTGRELMKQTMMAIQKYFGKVPVRISAQEYLVDFYRGYGFEPVGKSYLEDGIPHVEMLMV